MICFKRCKTSNKSDPDIATRACYRPSSQRSFISRNLAARVFPQDISKCSKEELEGVTRSLIWTSDGDQSKQFLYKTNFCVSFDNIIDTNVDVLFGADRPFNGYPNPFERGPEHMLEDNKVDNTGINRKYIDSPEADVQHRDFKSKLGTDNILQPFRDAVEFLRQRGSGTRNKRLRKADVTCIIADTDDESNRYPTLASSLDSGIEDDSHTRRPYTLERFLSSMSEPSAVQDKPDLGTVPSTEDYWVWDDNAKKYYHCDEDTQSLVWYGPLD